MDQTNDCRSICFLVYIKHSWDLQAKAVAMFTGLLWLGFSQTVINKNVIPCGAITRTMAWFGGNLQSKEKDKIYQPS